MPKPPSNFLLTSQPHEEAAKWIESKPLLSRQAFDSLLPELRARAFLVTGLEDANIAAEVRSLLAEVPRGADWVTTRNEIADHLGTFLADAEKDPGDARAAALARAEILIRTHGFQAYQRTQHEVMTRQSKVFTYWQYLSLDDEKVRPAHRALNGIVAPAESPFWHDHSPPWQWGCRCRKVALLPEEVAEIQAEDAGKLPEAQRVIEGTALDRLERGTLDRGPTNQVDLRTDVQRGNLRGYHFDPGSLALNPEDLKSRYDDTTWAEFERGAKANKLPDGRTVWDWLHGAKAKKVPASGGPVPTPAKPVPAPVNPVQTVVKPVPPAVKQVPAKVSQAPSRAIGTPVGDALEPVKSMAQKEVDTVARVMGLIQQVHGDGILPKINVDHVLDPDSLGEYKRHKQTLKPDSIAFRADGPWPDLTVAHETGHFLDHAGAPGTRPFWQLQTEHDTTQDLAAWWKAANDSKALGRIQALKVRTQKELKSKKYYLQPCEVWARSYAQYIAEESGDAVMKMQVQTILGSGGRYADRHWEESDFAPIRQAMTDLFVKWGWSKPQTTQAP